MNYSILIVLSFLSDLIESLYEFGVFTRHHILPTIVWLYVFCEHVYNTTLDKLVSAEYTLIVYNTPFSSGYAY